MINETQPPSGGSQTLALTVAFAFSVTRKRRLATISSAQCLQRISMLADISVCRCAVLHLRSASVHLHAYAILWRYAKLHRAGRLRTHDSACAGTAS